MTRLWAPGREKCFLRILAGQATTAAYEVVIAFRLISYLVRSTVNVNRAHVFGRDDLFELGEGELLFVLGQVVSEDLLQVLQVLRRQLSQVSENREKGIKCEYSTFFLGSLSVYIAFELRFSSALFSSFGRGS